MRQPDSAADSSSSSSSSARGKMAHPAMFPRRGSSSTSTTGGGGPPPSAGGAALSAEEYQPPLLGQPLLPASPAAASASPGPQPAPPPPQSLNFLPQAPLPQQPLGQAGAQMKKKSGFQITSVTPAQISASISSNNSIAEDTESYDDLDESHTEDLSSSEILDVSLSRATDLGEPERSSSEETLNNFQEAETPGAVSPNQPHLSQQHPPLPHPAQQSVVINGSVHPHHVHHHHPLHHHGHHHPSPSGAGSTPASGGPPPSPSFRKLSTTGSSDNVITTAPVSAASSTGSPASVMSNIRTTSTSGSIGVSPVTGTSTLSNMGGGSSGVTSGMLGTVNLNIPGTGNVNALSGTGSSVNVNILSGIGNGTSASSNVINNVTNPTAGLGSSQQQPAAGTSRFRVVKLDSSSEPFKKGRWTCTEFYDKDNTVAVTEGVAVNKAVETIKQNPLEVTSERESTSGSSVSSSVSTLSHYTESVGSGEMGASTVVQQQAFQGVGPQQMDFSSAGPQPIPASSIPQSVSQSQLAQVQLHAQEVNYSQQKQGVQPPASASLTTVTGVQSTPVNIVGVSSALGHQQPAMQSMAQQQLPYSQPAQPVQTLPVVQQQQLQYGQQQQQQQAVPTQMAPGVVKQVSQNSVTGTMPDYMQHQQMLQTSAPAMQSGTTAVGTGTPVPVAQAPSMQPSVQAHPAVTPAQPVAHAQTVMPAVLPLTTHLVDGEDESSSGASVVAIDNKIEQAMDLVKSHLMYAVREEVEVLKEQIKELIEKNSQLEQENTLLKTLASPEQLAQFQAQLQTGSPPSSQPQGTTQPTAQPASQGSGPSA
ncbi:PREDICTED: TSC22 domain family protein 1 isoform X6 [Gavialis gangeticus]|uniref:TSC22 domain family protein 1 isoform X6 n=1 Tax=Gavialis gangeticus TaxID=94835 RepID=UPI00092E6BF2|nr:PREDICTED: TSC22 domain family protein 1 isoform X6 [Gavialis gangeticus]